MQRKERLGVQGSMGELMVMIRMEVVKCGERVCGVGKAGALHTSTPALTRADDEGAEVLVLVFCVWSAKRWTREVGTRRGLRKRTEYGRNEERKGRTGWAVVKAGHEGGVL